jgi:hypothetical protein
VLREIHREGIPGHRSHDAHTRRGVRMEGHVGRVGGGEAGIVGRRTVGGGEGRMIVGGSEGRIVGGGARGRAGEAQRSGGRGCEGSVRGRGGRVHDGRAER